MSIGMAGHSVVARGEEGTTALSTPASASRGHKASTRAIALFLFLGLAGVFALSTGGHTYSGDEEGMLEATRSLVQARSTIDINPGNRTLAAWRLGPDGEPTGVSGIGQSVVGIPFYLTGKVASRLEKAEHRETVTRLFLLFTNSCVVAGIAVVVFLLALQLGAGRRSAVALAVIYGLGTMAWSHAKTFFSEPLAAFLLSLGVLLALRAAAVGRDSARRRTWLAAGAGLACGAALMARVSMVIFPPLIGAYLLVTVARRLAWRDGLRTALDFAVGAIPPLVVLGLVNEWRYGSVTDLGYTGFQVVRFNYPIVSGLHGLLFSSGKSIFLYAPVTLVGVLGLPASLRRRPAETLLLLGLVAANFGFFARVGFWHGDHAWGPRYMQIVLPLMVVLVAPVLGLRPWRWATGIAGGLGFLFPGLLGVILFFNVYFVVGSDALGAEPPVRGEARYVHHFHFDPYWSPLAGHFRLVGAVVRNTAARIDGSDPSIQPFPAPQDHRFHWYDRPPQLDTWWAWFPVIGIRRVYLLLALVAVAAVTVSGWRLVVLLR